jgi:hypothetical protein
MDQRERQPDGQRREALRRSGVSDPEDDDEEQGGENQLDDERCKQTVATRGSNARDTPTKPIPTWVRPGAKKTAARTADPQPPKTTTNVPRNSADSRCNRVGSGIAMSYPGM